MFEHITKMIEELDQKAPLVGSSDFMHRRVYVQEFRTLVFGLPRQCGKTTFIRRNAKCGDMIFTPNQMIAKLCYHDHGVYAQSISVLMNATYASGIDIHWHPRTIWLDEVDLHDREVWNGLERLIASRSQKIICLGTF